jgi:hypothetical protein
MGPVPLGAYVCKTPGGGVFKFPLNNAWHAGQGICPWIILSSEQCDGNI